MATHTTDFVKRVAAKADVSENTVQRYLAGMPNRGLQQRRVEAALRDLGMFDLIRTIEKLTGTEN